MSRRRAVSTLTNRSSTQTVFLVLSLPPSCFQKCGGLLLAKSPVQTKVSITAFSCFRSPDCSSAAPLGNRRRFGPAPVEETAPPQLAQPSPSAYPRPPPQNDRESSRQDRGDTPPANSAGKLIIFHEDSPWAPLPLPVVLQIVHNHDTSRVHCSHYSH